MTKPTYRGETPKIIALGAEAALIKHTFLGMPAVYKVRLPKPYRDPKLDLRLRSERTVTEAKIIHDLRLAGLPVPALYYVSLSEGLIVMEYVEGDLLRDLINRRVSGYADLVRELGKVIALMHGLGVVHGDITTSNVVVREGTPYVIDFGLAKYSSELEDIGVDVHLFIRAVESTHYDVMEEVITAFFEGYASIAGEERVKEIKEKVREIRLRGRYVEERRQKRNK